MPKTNSAILLLICLLLSINALADEPTDSDSDYHLSSVVSLYLEALHSETEYRAPSQLPRPMAMTSFSNSASQPIADLDFQNSAALVRVSKLRELSLLTLAEGRGTRLYFGVNKRGLVGLHFRALTRGADERCLELARMPYLAKSEPDVSSD